MTDTAGYSDIVFGLFGLLGYQFSPRLADIGGTRFLRLHSEADYGVLNGLSRHRINRGESRHSLARDVFYGKRGELHQRYREGQEDQLSALGFVVNAIIFWNTCYTELVLDALRESGKSIDKADIQRPSPLGREHINIVGHHSFTLPEEVAEGRLRSLAPQH